MGTRTKKKCDGVCYFELFRIYFWCILDWHTEPVAINKVCWRMNGKLDRR